MTTSADGRPPHRPTMIDVARRAGVSTNTVSRVVNGVTSVDTAMAERVLAAIAELGFRRNGMARNLRAGTATSTIGLLIEDLANPFYSAIAAAVAAVALERGAMLVTASSEEDADRERRLLLAMCERRFDGLLVVPAGNDQAYLRPEVEMGIPMVFLDRPPTGLRADTVLIDNARGAHDAVSALVGAGHQRIAVLADSLTIYTMRERLAAAERALDAFDVPYSRELVRYDLHSPAATKAALGHMLDSATPPTAVFALNNRITLGALSEIVERDVPIEVVGFDDFETADLMPVPLTVVRHETAELGRVGAELLFERIRGDVSRPRTVVLPTSLVRRGVGAGPVDPGRHHA